VSQRHVGAFKEQIKIDGTLKKLANNQLEYVVGYLTLKSLVLPLILQVLS